MPDWIIDAKGLAGIISAIAGLLGIFLGYRIKNAKNKQSLDQLAWKNWQEFLDDSADFRKEVKVDLEKVKKERDEILNRMRDLDVKLTEVVRENLEMKKREIILEHELDDLKRENEALKKKIAELKQDKNG